MNPPGEAIKALNLAQAEPSKIRDHAIFWRARIDKLRARRTLPEWVLFAVSEAGPDRAQREAYQEALDDLRSDEVQLMHAQDNPAHPGIRSRLKPVGLPSAIDRSGFRPSG